MGQYSLVGMGDARVEEQQVVALASTSGPTVAVNRKRPIKRIIGQQVGNMSLVVVLYACVVL